MELNINNNAWIAQCDPQSSIADLFIPGTHDSMTADCQQRYYKTQHLSLAQQLQIGVRFFDIRLRREMVAAHREWISDISAVQIFEICQHFLLQNPCEFIVMRIQNANENKNDYEQYGAALKPVVQQYADLFYRWQLNEQNQFILPQLKQVAGKIVALECSPNHYDFCTFTEDFWAAPWHQNQQLFIQDLWDGPALEEKKQAISTALAAPADKLLLNHISATNGELAFPDAYAQALNPFTSQLWQLTPNKLRGIQIYDFIDAELSQLIIQRNFTR